ncbi:MAG: hypothetical protein R2697_04980 [Ilumatobacteraceae bacterium]
MLTAIAIALLIAWRLRSVASDRRALQTPLARWIGVGLAQAALGYIQYFSDVPELLVGIHVLGATLVMIATTFLLLDTRRAVPDEAVARPDGLPSRPAVV